MPIVSNFLQRFNLGELSPLVQSRTDLGQYPAALKKLENFIPLLQGPAQRRGGTRFIAKTGNGDQPVVLIDFAFSETTTYIIEVGDQYMRFFYQGAAVLNDDGTVYQIETPWTQADLFRDTGICALKQVQSGDVMYIVCPGQAPQKLARYGHTDWRVSPLLGWNADKQRPNATAVALWRERLVLAYDQTVCFSQSGAFENFELTTGVKEKGVITSVSVQNGGYASVTAPGTITCSGSERTYVYYNTSQATASSVGTVATIRPREISGGGAEAPIASDDPIEINVYSEQMDKIEWLCPAGNLLVGTTGGEFAIGETTTVDPFGPENVKVVPETSYGSSSIQALRVGAVVVFVQRAGRKIREFLYDYQGDSYMAVDLTVYSEHVTKGGVLAMAWQSEPIETLWSIRKDGQLLGFTYSKEQQMAAWHRHVLGGGGAVSQMAVIPAAHGGRDELWLSVRRVVDGQTVYYLELVEPGHESGEPISEAFFVDSGVTIRSEEPLMAVAGLDHLEGYEVAILGDGGVQPRRTVSGGSVDLQYPAKVVHVGLPYTSRLTTVNFELMLQDGSAQGRKKRIIRVGLRLLESKGGAAGPSTDDLEMIEYRLGSDRMDEATPLFTGDKEIYWPGGWETEGSLTVIQDYPLPFTLTGLPYDIELSGKN